MKTAPNLFGALFFFAQKLKKIGALSHVYVLFFTLISFVIFSGSSMTEASSYLRAMFGGAGLPVVSKTFLYQLRNYGFTVLIAIAASTPFFVKIKEKLSAKKAFSKAFNTLETVYLLLLLVIVTAYLADGSFNPFLYFRF